jgi:flagellar FliL protein
MTTAEKSKPTEAGEAKKGGSKKLVLIIAAVVIGVTLMESAAVFMFMPSPQAAAKAEAEEKLPEPEEDESDSGKDVVEFDLGEYRITSFQPMSSTTVRIDFHLYGMVLAGPKNEEELETQFKAKERRLRDLIFVVVRGAELSDLTDAGLGLLKRRILETTNKVLGKRLVHSVVFSDFSFVEQ